MKPALFALVMLLATAAVAQSSTVVNQAVSRQIDLTNHLATVTSTVTVKNTGSAAATAYAIKTDPKITGTLAFTSAQINNGDVTPVNGDSVAINLKANEQATIEIVQVYIHAQKPFPEELSQTDKQLVTFTASLYYPSAYKTVTQTTEVLLAGKAESHTKAKPVKVDGNKINYGPYTDVAADAADELNLHFENFTPFLTTTQYEREIMVSHWGYSTITETAEMVHSGGKLKGGFSRLDFQRSPEARRNAIEKFVTRLPAAASDVYYRDVIGNISTSHLRVEDEAVIMEIQPRFPLFGGWKTHYTIGYTEPSTELLSSEGGRFFLTARFASHIYSNFVIDHATIKVVLPEGASNIKVETPFAVERSEEVGGTEVEMKRDEISSNPVLKTRVTYFDTTGRPVIVLKKDNLVEEHMQEFTVSYDFSTTQLVREPLMAVAFFAVLFTAAILFNRIDLSVEPTKKDN